VHATAAATGGLDITVSFPRRDNTVTQAPPGS